MTEYWPCLLAAVCAIAVLRCAARQRHGMRSLLAGAVCGLGALALLGLLEPVTGIALPLNRFTAFCAGVLGLPGVTALLIFRGCFYKCLANRAEVCYTLLEKRVEHTAAGTARKGCLRKVRASQGRIAANGSRRRL